MTEAGGRAVGYRKMTLRRLGMGFLKELPRDPASPRPGLDLQTLTGTHAKTCSQMFPTANRENDPSAHGQMSGRRKRAMA